MKLLLAFMAFVAGVSLACSATRSAGALPESVSATGNQSSPTPATEQEQALCSLNLSQAPALHGLRLGMTPEEVLTYFPGSETDPEVKSQLSASPSKLGTSNLIILPSKYESRDQFIGISQITVSLLDGRASRLNVGYAGPEYSHVDEFVEKFVAGTNLPPAGQWKAHAGLANELKILKCAGFEARVFAGGPGGSLNYVLLHDLEADNKLQERRRKARAKATPTPAP